MPIYTTFELPDSGQPGTIDVLFGSHFFDAMSTSKGDQGLLMQCLITSSVKINGKEITEEEVRALSFRDVSYLASVIGLQIDENYHL